MCSDEMDLKNKLANIFIPVILGVVVFLLTIGHKILNVKNIAWMMQSEDSAQHYLGWVFFRNAPWTFPVGLNPDFGLEISSSIFYTDSIPLFALFFKIISQIIPEQFQYFGLWILMCFLLQAWFAWCILGKISQNFAIRSLGTALFLFSPPMLFRFPGHESLAGHWLILAGIYLCITGEVTHRKWKWLILAIVSCLIHAYLFAIIFCLWTADLLRRVFYENNSIKATTIETTVFISASAFSLWQAGFFYVKSGKVGHGYGHYKMNLLTPFNPFTGLPDVNSWSYILPSFSMGPGDYEGFNYFGLGVILLICIVIKKAVTYFMDNKIDWHWTPLVCTCFLLSAFSITNNIGLASYNYKFTIPGELVSIANVIQSSGRMFWPVYYLLWVLVIFILVKNFRHRWAVGILFVCLIIQAADSSAGWLPRREQLTIVDENSWSLPLQSPHWDTVVARYDKIRRIPPGKGTSFQMEIPYLAALHNLPTDAVYLARLDSEKWINHLSYTRKVLETGAYEGDTLYFIEPEYVNFVRLTINPREDMFTTLDNHAILAPKWFVK